MCINKTKRTIMGNFILLEPSPQYFFNVCPNAGFMLVQCCSMLVQCCSMLVQCCSMLVQCCSMLVQCCL